MRCCADRLLRALVVTAALALVGMPGFASARLVVSLTAQGPFVYGQTQAVDVTVTNTGPRSESGPVMVIVTVPPELALLGTAGTAWTADMSAAPDVALTWPGGLARNATTSVTVDLLAVAGGSGVTLTAAIPGNGQGQGNGQATLTVDITAPAAELVTTTYSVAVSDPINGTVNPKAIPGATVLNVFEVQNVQAGPVDNNSLEIVLPIPPETMLRVLDFPGGTDPIHFVEGAVPSGLTFGRGRWGRGRADYRFSDDGGASWGYAPVPDALGFDAAVTHVRVRPSGAMAGATAAGPSSFQLQYQVLVR